MHHLRHLRHTGSLVLLVFTLLLLSACGGGGSEVEDGEDDGGGSVPTAPPAPPTTPPTPGAALSYATDIYPIWQARSCTGCHGSSGGLTLSGSASATYAELFEVAGRVNLATPSSSLILTKPATLGVSHGGGTRFASTSDADYQKILTWITQGALNN